jgi:integrase
LIATGRNVTRWVLKSPTQEQPEAQPNGNSGSGERGIRRFKTKEPRPKPFGVEFRVDGKRRNEFFADEKERDKRANELAKARREGVVHLPRRAELAAWQAFKTAIGDTPWQDVVAGWNAHQKTSGVVTTTLTVQEAVDGFLKDLDERKDFSADTVRQKRQKVKKLAEAFGANRLTQITGDDIEDWIESDLGYDNPHTFNNWRKHIRSFFDFYRKEIFQNPCDDIRTMDDATDHVGILTPVQTAKLFAFALTDNRRHIIGRLALEAFAGLRFASAYRLEKADINFKDKGILLPKHKIKTKRRHFVDGLPENLWTWLAVTSDACWAMTPAEYMREKSLLFTDAKVPHPHNCLRHSFCTYHVAAFKNPGLTATILCHRNQGMLWARYNGNATQEAGKLYWTITPETAPVLAQEAK